MKTQNYFIHCAVMFITCSLAIYMTSCKDNADKDVGESLVSVKRTPMRVVDSLECLYGIPFASDDELLQYSYYYNPECYSEYGVLSYQFARDYGFAEFIGHIGTYLYHRNNIINEYYNGLEVLSISQKPVIVYDYDNRPFYYEFPIIYRENELVGTITVAAQPFNKEIIHYMFPGVIKYNSHCYSYKRYVGEYPAVYYSNDDGNSFYMDKWEEEERTLQSVANDYYIADIHDAMQEKISRFNNGEVSDINYDLQQADYLDEDDIDISSLDDYVASFELTSETQDYWTEKSSSYTPREDGEIPDMVMEWIEESLSEVQASYQGFLPEYENHRLRLTRWKDFCGPAVMAWLYRGKHDSYNNVYLPLHEEAELIYSYGYPDVHTHYGPYGYDYTYYNMEPRGSDSNTYETRERYSNANDGGLYYAFFQYTDETCGQYPLLDWGLRASLPYATNGEYSIKFITAPISWIKNKQQPVVVEGIRGHAHYCGAIGYSYDQWWFIKYYMRLLVTDNGFFTQQHHYYPFWSILGGLNYAWVLNK